MNPKFDLLESPWVPCIAVDGSTIEMGLRDALAQAHQLRELAGESPLVTAALHRLLLAILHRVFGPATAGEWGVLWHAGLWDQMALDKYLYRWRGRFDLFHPQHPFYQASDDRVKPKSVASLAQDIASGNNPTLFDHHTKDSGLTLTPAQAARMLVAAHAFGLAGLSGLSQKYTDGPCARGVTFLVQGETLFETLALNLLRYPSETVMPQYANDRPSWEMDDPFTPARSVPRGYLDYLTWQSRRMVLMPEAAASGVIVRQMTTAPGLRLDSAVADPMKHYRRDEKRGPLVLRFNEHRALWRDSAALLQLQASGYLPPRVFDWLATLVDRGYLEASQTRRYLALGMANDQARVHFYRTERMPLPLAYLQDEKLVEYLQEALEMADSCGRQLWGATRTLARFVLSPQSDAESALQPNPKDLQALTRQWAVERRYWSRLEIPFRETMEALPKGQEQALSHWREILLRTAREAFGHVADNLGHDPGALKAVVRATDQLAAGLARALPASD